MPGLFHSYPEQQRDLRWVTVGLTALATVLLLMRLVATWKNRGWFGLEDVFVVTAHIFLVIFGALVFMSTVYGFGKHRKDLEASGGNIQKALMYFWLTQHFYIMTNMFNKLAFLTLYYRIFSMPTFRKICVALVIISVFRGVSFTLVGIFQCTPIQKVWIKSTPGHCVNTRVQRWSQGASNLITDIAIFVLPMPVISRLNMSVGNRIGLVILFSIGFLVCLITLLRMATLPQTLVQTEPTWQSAPTNLWSFIESAVGVICACLISLRKTISAYWPQKWKTNNGSNRNYYNSGSEGRRRVRTAESGFTMGAMKPKGLGETHASVMTNTMGMGLSRHSSQEHIIDGITVTKDVVITRVDED